MAKHFESFFGPNCYHCHQVLLCGSEREKFGSCCLGFYGLRSLLEREVMYSVPSLNTLQFGAITVEKY